MSKQDDSSGSCLYLHILSKREQTEADNGSGFSGKQDFICKIWHFIKGIISIFKENLSEDQTQDRTQDQVEMLLYLPQLSKNWGTDKQ